MAIAAADIGRLEALGANAWPAETIEHLHGWRLQFDRGVTRRANSVLPNAWDGGTCPDDVVAEVERRYRRRGLRPCFKLTAAACPGNIEDLLDRRGYRAEGHSLVLTATADVDIGPSSPKAVDLLDEPTPEWAEACWPSFEGGPDRRARHALVGRIRSPHVFALARREGRPAGAALAVAEGGWGCVTALYTLPAFRRRGVARSLVGALVHWLRCQDASSFFLQVEADNKPARHLYAGAGFRPAYPYYYRALIPPDGSSAAKTPRDLP